MFDPVPSPRAAPPPREQVDPLYINVTVPPCNMGEVPRDNGYLCQVRCPCWLCVCVLSAGALEYSVDVLCAWRVMACMAHAWPAPPRRGRTCRGAPI